MDQDPNSASNESTDEAAACDVAVADDASPPPSGDATEVNERPRFHSVHAKRCSVCDQLLTVHEQVVGPTCSRRECREHQLRGDVQARLEQEARLRKRALESRTTIAQLEGIASPERLGVGVLPSNDRALTPLPAERIDRFKQRLIGIVQQVLSPTEDQADTAEDSEPYLPSPVLDAAKSQRVTAACATCRGHCCPQGGDHAFVNVETIERYLQQHPDHGREEIVAAYLSRIGAETFEDSCVYHAAQGCRLPREMRAAICNQYLCKGLNQFLFQLPDPVEGSSFVVATEEDQVVRSAIVDDDGVRVLAPSGELIEQIELPLHSTDDPTSAAPEQHSREEMG